MLTKILIANRGEIACRIIRTAKRLGVRTVAVYSDADARALHVIQADEAVHIGPSPATESYLRGDKIIAAARATGAEGIHPGYGFLSENADFADAVTKAGLKFIGPSAAAMRALGGKAAAKEIAIKAGVPVVPGYQGETQDAKTLAAEAKKIGYPVMIKAVAGGGGRGMRLVENEADLPELLASAQREAEGAFGDARVLIEKVVVKPRHIEVQVFGDSKGNVVHIFERDCTLQRRNQKVVEEAPAPGMSDALREKMCAAAVKLAKSVGYEGAGTVEFLVEGGPSSLAPSVAHPQPAQLGADAKWFFIEMNTRLQVEHPVTEEITGLDLVEWQLRVASGEPLPLRQDQIRMKGHAIEVRLCAEDPAKGFLPSIGRIFHFDAPSAAGLRVETGITSDGEVSPFYDSMVVKLITACPTRDAAREQMIEAIHRTVLAGPVTNQAFLAALLRDPQVARGDMDTGLIGRDLEQLAAPPARPHIIAESVLKLIDHLADDAEALTSAADAPRPTPWLARDAFQLGQPRVERRTLSINGHPTTQEIRWNSTGAATPRVPQGERPLSITELRPAPGRLLVIADGMQIDIAVPEYDPSAIDDGATGDTIRAPINGKVARMFVAEGDQIEKGQRIAVVEAMKMEHVLHAARAGTISKIGVREGQQVTQGTVIAALAEA